VKVTGSKKKEPKFKIDAKEHFATEGIFYTPGDKLELKIARVDGMPNPKLTMIGDKVVLDVEKKHVLTLQPLVRMEGDTATTKAATAIRLQK
jgi:hypothetical protein